MLVDHCKVGPESEQFFCLFNGPFAQASVNKETFEEAFLFSRSSCHLVNKAQKQIIMKQSLNAPDWRQSESESIDDSHGIVEHRIIPRLYAGRKNYFIEVVEHIVECICGLLTHVHCLGKVE